MEVVELLTTACNICPNCGTQLAYFRHDEKYWPWDRVEQCASCGLEWLCVGTPEGPGIKVIGVDEIGLRPVCPNCETGMSYGIVAACWKCQQCGYVDSQ